MKPPRKRVWKKEEGQGWKTEEPQPLRKECVRRTEKWASEVQENQGSEKPPGRGGGRDV